MSKYIRTKDGKIVKINLEGDVFTSRYEIVGEPKDTIEELCDEFVFEGVDDKPLLCTYEELIYWFNHSKEQQFQIRNCYGAIWTDKGLIYVAKMNDQGELELI